MAQQINLYVAQYPKRAPFGISKKQAAIIVSISLFVSAAYGYPAYVIENLKYDLKIEQQLLKSAKNNSNNLKTLIKKPSGERLKLELSALQDNLKHKKAIKSNVDSQGDGVDVSFSQRYVALAQNHVPGLWLTNIEFAENGNKVILTGQTRKPDLVTRYLENLSKDPAFAGLSFSAFQLYENAQGTNGSEKETMEFVVSTHELPSFRDATKQLLSQLK